MSRNDLKPCQVCPSIADTSISPWCSQECRTADGAIEDLGKAIAKYKADKKWIFFYDFAFGDLCDLYTTYLLRRVKAKTLADQRQVDNALGRLEETILTKMNKYSPGAATRITIKQILVKLLRANHVIWKWKDKFWKPEQEDIGISGGDWAAFMAAYRDRDLLRQQLDCIVEGQTMTAKTYQEQPAGA